MSEPVICVENIAKSFGSQQVLQDVSLSISAGQTFVNAKDRVHVLGSTLDGNRQLFYNCVLVAWQKKDLLTCTFA